MFSLSSRAKYYASKKKYKEAIIDLETCLKMYQNPEFKSLLNLYKKEAGL